MVSFIPRLHQTVTLHPHLTNIVLPDNVAVTANNYNIVSYTKQKFVSLHNELQHQLGRHRSFRIPISCLFNSDLFLPRKLSTHHCMQYRDTAVALAAFCFSLRFIPVRSGCRGWNRYIYIYMYIHMKCRESGDEGNVSVGINEKIWFLDYYLVENSNRSDLTYEKKMREQSRNVIAVALFRYFCFIFDDSNSIVATTN